MTSKLPYTTISVLASLALAGGPAAWAAQAESMERLARKDAESKKRTRAATPDASPDGRPDQKSPDEKPDASSAGLVAPSAAKPADTDSSSLNLCLSSNNVDIPAAALRPSGDAPPPCELKASLHRPSYQAHAPPLQSNSF
ncbi:MAG TPA: hypothetical protein VJZ71_16340 [Phycisphaerae bacterium]|nr:hypothetical protein [Phycisphaerae bacterium]